jgi:hypothetical protein
MTAVKIAAFGRTGAQKSTMGNCILREYVFEVGQTLDSQTTQTKNCTRTVDGCEITFVDTPGFIDSKGEEADHHQLAIMVTELRALTNVNALVIMSNMSRFDTSVQELLLRFAKIFERIDIWGNLCFVFTGVTVHDRTSRADFLARNRKDFRQRAVDLISQCCPLSRSVDTIKDFCVDFHPEGNDPYSSTELAAFLSWAKAVTFISLEKIDCPDRYYMSSKTETKRVNFDIREVRRYGNEEDVGKGVGTTTGAAIGSIFGPVGTLVGAVGGSFAGQGFGRANRHIGGVEQTRISRGSRGTGSRGTAVTLMKVNGKSKQKNFFSPR